MNGKKIIDWSKKLIATSQELTAKSIEARILNQELRVKSIEARILSQELRASRLL